MLSRAGNVVPKRSFSFPALFTLFVLLCSAAPAFPEDDTDAKTKSVQQLVEDSRNSIVVIKQTGRSGVVDGIGAGFVVSADGLIATSLHVIGEARPLSVTFHDGQNRPVSAIHAWDRTLDLALLKVEASDLPFLKLGDSDDLKQGTSVIAIGNPQGLTHSVVQGVVSAIRDLGFGPMIQVAIPVEPGNSGGPLIDRKGRAQGIISMKSVVTENLGFATPINALKSLMKSPNTVPLDRWLALGVLDTNSWRIVGGGNWKRKAGVIQVEGTGTGFGGRALSLSAKKLPPAPYEVSVSVKLGNESGAAGLAFGADGGDVHYGFYPTAGQMRLTRFDGPTVFSWNILQEKSAPQYRPGEWNHLRVRVEEKKFFCYLNGEMLFEESATVPEGLAGLAKFRDTRAEFKRFQAGKEYVAPITPEFALDDNGREKMENFLRNNDPDIPREWIEKSDAAAALLLQKSSELEKEASRLKQLAAKVHEQGVARNFTKLFENDAENISLFSAALWVSRLENKDLDLEAYENELSTMAEEVKAQFGEDFSDLQKLEQLCKYLFEQNGFHGSRTDYYNRANSHMDKVIDDREGLPITLSILFMELGKKTDIPHLEGMAFPGHFMVRYNPPDGAAVYFDVYDSGKIVAKDDLYSLISRHSEISLRESDFRPATSIEIMVRMLKNLISVSAEESISQTLAYSNLLLSIVPDSHYDRWRRAFLLFQTGNRAEAKKDLRILIDKRPEGLDIERLEEFYERLE
ncbi:MAG: tetratricopeptide repeat protein [Verrucomicrobiales bacterium]